MRARYCKPGCPNSRADTMEASMDQAERSKWGAIALERLTATGGDDDRWSFLFRTEGAQTITYCPWSQTQHMDFDGTIDGLDLPWSDERTGLIESGKAEPTAQELAQWREAMCRALIDSDESWIAHIVPLWADGTIAAYAFFATDGSSDPDQPPVLKGVFDTLDAAMAAVAADGATAKDA